jgi:hypothetical protein
VDWAGEGAQVEERERSVPRQAQGEVVREAPIAPLGIESGRAVAMDVLRPLWEGKVQRQRALAEVEGKMRVLTVLTARDA